MGKEENDDVIVDESAGEGSEDELEALSSSADAKVKKLREELAQVKKEKQEYLDGWQRAKADYVNALKRFEEEKRGAVLLGKTLGATAFLPVMDSLIRAEALGEIPEIFSGIGKQLHEAAKTLGLSKFGAPGELFDPALHEALSQELASSKEEDGTILEVYEVGWRSGEAVLRPAKVRVAHYEG